MGRFIRISRLFTAYKWKGKVWQSGMKWLFCTRLSDCSCSCSRSAPESSRFPHMASPLWIISTCYSCTRRHKRRNWCSNRAIWQCSRSSDGVELLFLTISAPGKGGFQIAAQWRCSCLCCSTGVILVHYNHSHHYVSNHTVPVLVSPGAVKVLSEGMVGGVTKWVSDWRQNFKWFWFRVVC